MSRIWKGSALLEKRNKLCQVIASLPANASIEVVTEILDPIVTHWKSQKEEQKNIVNQMEENDDEVVKNDGVTPLMVACDKSQVACLEFIATQMYQDIYDGIWGYPLDISSENCGSNAAMHFAAMSGCTDCIDHFSALLRKLPQSTSDERHLQENGKEEQTPKNVHNWLVKLVSQRNGHGDTPLMMASTAGHIDTLRQWTSRLVESLSAEGNLPCRGRGRQHIRDLFQLQNDSGDSALSLACGHGHFSVVDFLIHNQELFSDDEKDGIVTVTYDDVQMCKRTLDRIDSVLNQMKHSEEYQTRRENVRRCLVMLQVTLARAAERSMESLLQAEEGGTDGLCAAQSSQKQANGKKVSKRTKLNKKRTKKSKTTQSAHDESSDEADGPSPGSDEDDKSSDEQVQKNYSGAWGRQFQPNQAPHTTGSTTADVEHERPARFMSLQEETMVPPVLQKLEVSGQVDDVSSVVRLGEPLKSVEEMLRERYREPSMNDHTIDAVMDSLCLDASMHLLSPHGMAMKLSPSQLDAVAGLLKKQLDAVDEAKKIQGRLRTKMA